ncbi:hypothetical protein WMY93_033807 [Mugilogobius chulae]|uniref:Uncharacterized protein n=1 Tax=Mugilogobius chulae TaxID=88201 RepID=A0AAW0MJM3_9GOBI
MEDRARRDNLLIFNLKEGAEGANTLAYLEANIPKWFPVFASSSPEIMRAHRLGPPSRASASSGGSGQRPAPGHPELSSLHGPRPEATSKRRRPCYKTMHEARIKGFDAFLLYPATIKLQRGNETHSSRNTSRLENFLTTLNANSDQLACLLRSLLKNYQATMMTAVFLSLRLSMGIRQKW